MKLNKYFNNPLGAQVAPIGFSFKRMMDLSWLGPAISASASHINTGVSLLWDKARQREANESNEKIAQETNAQNYKMWQEQLAYQRQQYQREVDENRFLVDQAYRRDLESSDPAFIRQRLLNAGINPTLAMYGGSGSAGSHVAAQVGHAPSKDIPNPIPAQGWQYTPRSPLNLPTDMSSLGSLISDSVAQRELLDQKWIEILSKADLDPETKNKIIRTRMFHSDKYTNRYDKMQDEILQGLVNDNILKAADVAIADEKNAQLRKDWKYINSHHKKDLEILTQQISRMIVDNRIILTDEKITEKQYQIIENEYNKLKRENDLFNGDITFRSVFELLKSLFSSNIVSTLLLMKRK